MQQVDATTLDVNWKVVIERLGIENFLHIYGPALQILMEDVLGEERVLQALGEERALQVLARRVGRERLEQMLRELPDETPQPRRPRRSSKKKK